MKHWKRALAGVLCAASVLTCMADCSGKKTTSGDPAASGDGEKDYPVIRLMQHRMTPESCADEALIEEELNKIFREKCGCEVDIVFMNFGDVPDKLNLMLTGGEDSLDIFSSLTFSSTGVMAANGQILDITPYMDNELKDTKALFDDYPGVLACGQVDGKQYGLPSITGWTSPNIYGCKISYADNAGVDLSQVTTMDELTEALIKMKEASPDTYFIPASTHPYWWPKGMDYLGDQSYLGVLTDPANSTTIENYYESDLFLNHLENVKIWQEKEIILPDGMSNGMDAGAFMAVENGLTAGSTGYAQDLEEWLFEVNTNHTYGDEEIVGCYVNERYLTSGNVATYMWHVTPFSDYPSEACKVLNELYTNPEASMLLVNGIEGKHYEIDENGQLTYPEGVTAETSGWYSGFGGMYEPNAMITPTWDYQLADLNERYEQGNREAIASLALSFTADVEPVADQVAACQNVIDQYYLPLINGCVDIDTVLPEFQAALKDAGIDDIIACKQEQLDAWLASNNG